METISERRVGEDQIRERIDAVQKNKPDRVILLGCSWFRQPGMEKGHVGKRHGMDVCAPEIRTEIPTDPRRTTQILVSKGKPEEGKPRLELRYFLTSHDDREVETDTLRHNMDITERVFGAIMVAYFQARSSRGGKRAFEAHPVQATQARFMKTILAIMPRNISTVRFLYFNPLAEQKIVSVGDVDTKRYVDAAMWLDKQLEQISDIADYCCQYLLPDRFAINDEFDAIKDMGGDTMAFTAVRRKTLSDTEAKELDDRADQADQADKPHATTDDSESETDDQI